MVILGTMASIAARDIPGLVKDKEAFFYHHDNNHFWKILQMTMEPQKEPRKLKGKKVRENYLNSQGIAMGNIVSEILVDEKLKTSPDDQHIFTAYQKSLLSKTKKEEALITFKKGKPAFRKLLAEKPLFFTCREDKKILDLVSEYFKTNHIKRDPKQAVHFLLTPTRCNLGERSLGWKYRMARAGVKTGSLKVPDQIPDHFM